MHGAIVQNVAGVCAVLIVGACSAGSLSERDTQIEQGRLRSDAKRKELQQIASDYTGTSKQEAQDITYPVRMRLEIKDVPTPVEGIPEPVLMPVLSGFIRFYVGGPGEFIVFTVEKVGFDTSRNSVEIAASNPESKELSASLSRNGEELAGPWSAPSLSFSGKLLLKKAEHE